MRQQYSVGADGMVLGMNLPRPEAYHIMPKVGGVDKKVDLREEISFRTRDFLRLRDPCWPRLALDIKRSLGALEMVKIGAAAQIADSLKSFAIRSKISGESPVSGESPATSVVEKFERGCSLTNLSLLHQGIE